MPSALDFAERFMSSTPLPSLTSPYTLIGLALLPIALWLYTALVAPYSFPTLSNARILLLIAHPDDEAMFFSPTLLQLTKPSLNNHIKLLCLSAGDADGLGDVRINELRESARLLGIRQDKDVFCLDVPELRDGMKETWDERVIAELLMHTFVESSPTATSSKKDKSGSSSTAKSRDRASEKDRPRDKERESHRPRSHARSPSSTTSDSASKLRRTPSNSTASSGGSSSKRREFSMSSSSKSKDDAQSTSSGSTTSVSTNSSTPSKRLNIFSSLSLSTKSKTAPNTPNTSPTSPTPASKPPVPNLDVIITFDASGVSNHPNHRSCHAGSLLFLRRLQKAAGPGWSCPVHLYTLTSVNVLRKYASVYDVVLSVVAGIVTIITGIGRASFKKGARGGYPSWLLYVSGVGEFGVARKAMYAAHKSQMRWFRWGWIGIGRYMVVNDLKRVNVK